MAKLFQELAQPTRVGTDLEDDVGTRSSEE
jgi:hypothetical protein